MTEVEETIVFDALFAIETHSEVLRELAQRDHSPAAIAAYRDGVYSVGIKLQVLLGPEAIARGKAQREKIRKEAIEFFARQPQPQETK